MPFFNIAFVLNVAWVLFVLAVQIAPSVRFATKMLAAAWFFVIGPMVGMAVMTLVQPDFFGRFWLARDSLRFVTATLTDESLDIGLLSMGFFATVGAAVTAAVYVPVRVVLPRLIRAMRTVQEV